MNLISLVFNLIPVFIILFFLADGWNKGALLMIISIVKLFLSFFIARYLSGFLTQILMNQSNIRNYIFNFAISHENALTQLPGASFLFTGQAFKATLETVSNWIVYMGCFIIIFLLLIFTFSVLQRYFKKLNDVPVLGCINRAFGLIGGLIFGIILSLIILYIISFILIMVNEQTMSQEVLNSWLPVLYRSIV